MVKDFLARCHCNASLTCKLQYQQYVCLLMPPRSTYAPPPEHETDCHNNIGEHVHNIYCTSQRPQKQSPQSAAEEEMYTAVTCRHLPRIVLLLLIKGTVENARALALAHAPRCVVPSTTCASSFCRKYIVRLSPCPGRVPVRERRRTWCR